MYAAVPACHGFGECRSAKPVSEPEGGGGLAGAGRDGPTRTGPATVAITKFSCSGGVRAANVALHDLHGGTVRVAPSQREALRTNVVVVNGIKVPPVKQLIQVDCSVDWP